tara:strand:+ start:854 stop:1471 length:618 start_codon:yes stop_codon:yes gene_type:complete
MEFSETDIENIESEMNELVSARLPTKYGEFRIIAFPGEEENREHLAIIMGDITEGEVLVRVHSECLTGDTFYSKRCDCGIQLESAMEKIAKEGKGMIVYLRQEGRGIGLVNKLHAYNLQDEGMDTVEANEKLGFEGELREYEAAARILKSMSVSKIILMTNNPAKVEDLRSNGFEVKRIPHKTIPNKENKEYLKTKSERMGHELD